MQFTITLDRDEDGVWIAECPAVPGCIGLGATPDDATADVNAAVRLCLQVRAERGMPLTIETRQVDVTV